MFKSDHIVVATMLTAVLMVLFVWNQPGWYQNAMIQFGETGEITTGIALPVIGALALFGFNFMGLLVAFYMRDKYEAKRETAK